MYSTTAKVQLVFLVDTKSPANTDNVLYHRSLCLACTRILLYLNRFPFKEHLNTVQWNYHFFSTKAQDNTLTTKSSQFSETRSELLEKFFSTFLDILKANPIPSNVNTTLPHQWQSKGTSLKPVKLVYNALGAVVQDYIWDAPEIKSPVRPRPRGRSRRGTNKSLKVSDHCRLENNVQHTRNYVFICSSCPVSEGQLRSFCVGGNTHDGNLSTEDLLTRELFPNALLSQLESKNISVYWIDTGMGESDMGIGPETSGMSIMSSVLKRTHGTLIPMSVIVCPLQDGVGGQLQLVRGVKKAPTTCEDVETYGTDETRSTCNSILDSKHEVVAEQLKNGLENKANETESTHNPVTAPPVSASVVRKSTNTKLSTTLQTILSSLVLPSTSLLKDYLDQCTSNKGMVDRDKLVTPGKNDSNLFWLSTRDGVLLCILQLSSMYHHFTPNTDQNKSTPPPSSSFQHSQSTREVSDHDNLSSTSRRYSLTGAPLVNERKLPSKSFGKKVKKKLNLTTDDCSNDVNSQATDVKDTVTHSAGEPHSNMEEHRTNPPCIVALGLVKQTDVSLAWLKPTSVCSCTGLYVPRNIRETKLNLKSKLSSEEDCDPRGSCSSPNNTIVSKHFNTESPPSNHISKQENKTTASPSYSGLHLSPLIHLYRHPISPPSRHSLSSMARMRRSVSVPELFAPCSPSTGSDDSMFQVSSSRQGLSLPNFSMSQRVNILKRLSKRTLKVRCRRLSVPSYTLKASPRRGTNMRCPSLRSLSLSPRYPLLKLKDVLCCKQTEEDKMKKCLTKNIATLDLHVEPSVCLTQSGRYHSKQYLNLCLWLAKNGLLLLVSVQCGSDTSQLALLQPITSLVSTLTFIRPQHSHKLLHKLINPPCQPAAEESQTETTKDDSKFEGGSLQNDRKSLLQSKELTTVESRSVSKHIGPSECKPSDVLDLLKMADKDKHECTDESEGVHNQKRLLANSYASDPELYVSLQLLFSCHANLKTKPAVSNEAVSSAVFDSLVDLPPFTNLSLLPWFPYTSACGVDKKAVQKLQEFHFDYQMNTSTDRSDSKMKLITSLKQLYSSPSPHQMESHDQSHDIEHSQEDPMEQEPCPNDEDQATGELRPGTVDELLEWFDALYVEQVQGCADGDTSLRWVSKTLAQLSEHLTKLDQRSEVDQERLWDFLCTHVLCSNTQLSTKYEDLSTLSTKENGLSERKISEYLLQVLLHFEAMKLCSTVEIDTDSIAKQLISLLRKLSLLANPGLLGNSLQKIILPMYISSCQRVLVAVYEGLMLPLPSDLSSSPDFPSSPPAPLLSHGQLDNETSFDSDEERSLVSLEEPLAPKTTDAGAKKLFRHQSFQEVNSQRQITIPSKAVRKSKRRKKPKNSNLKPHSNAVQHVRRSPRIAKLSQTTDGSNTDGKGVCRTLFSRHYSLGGVPGNKRKRDGEVTDHVRVAKKLKGVTVQRHHTLVPDILVKETPVKKQVENYRRFKLQRLRSKCSVVCSPGVEVIEESPRRSFYSVPKVPRPKKTPLFKTPPIKEELKSRHISPNTLNKEPSPSALHSLLHGHIVTSPHVAAASGDGSNKDMTTTPCKHQTNRFTGGFTSPLLLSTKVDESPDLFDAKEHRSMTDLPHKHKTVESNYHRGTPSLISPNTLSSYTDNNSLVLLTESPLAQPERNNESSWRTNVTSTNKQPNYRSARMLTYDSENATDTINELAPSLPLQTLDTQSTTIRTSLPLRSQHENHSSVGEYSDSNLLTDVVFVSPPSPPSHAHSSTTVTEGAGRNSRVCLLTDLDPSIENESASMMAFALCTPPKDEPRDFRQAFSSFH